MIGYLLALGLAIRPSVALTVPDWSENAVIPAAGRANPDELDDTILFNSLRQGRTHTLFYPVDVTGILVPVRPFEKLLNSRPGEPSFERLRLLLGLNRSFKGVTVMWDWLGLHEYPQVDNPNIPVPAQSLPGGRMGYSRIHRLGTEGFTISYAACHSENLFRKPILGMTNRFPRTNEFFKMGIEGTKLMGPSLLKVLFGAMQEDMNRYRKLRTNLASIAVKPPEIVGLDNSLAQMPRVPLSLKPAPVPTH